MRDFVEAGEPRPLQQAQDQLEKFSRAESLVTKVSPEDADYAADGEYP